MHGETAAPDGRDASVFTIHVGAALGREWTHWLAGAEILERNDGSGLITAQVADQSMLFGLLLRIRDLGIPLLGLYPCSKVALSSIPGC